jgi:feruloyl esterase
VNTADYTANPRWSYEYYDKVAKTMGQAATDEFMRFYVAIGIFHNRNVGRNPLTNETVPNYLDFISLLDDWVDGSKTPADTLVLRDMENVPPFAVRSSFPMCRYPNYPRYQGQGDPKQAANYSCSAR